MRRSIISKQIVKPITSAWVRLSLIKTFEMRKDVTQQTFETIKQIITARKGQGCAARPWRLSIRCATQLITFFHVFNIWVLFFGAHYVRPPTRLSDLGKSMYFKCLQVSFALLNSKRVVNILKLDGSIVEILFNSDSEGKVISCSSKFMPPPRSTKKHRDE